MYNPKECEVDEHKKKGNVDYFSFKGKENTEIARKI
jgi:hypothetical protein